MDRRKFLKLGAEASALAGTIASSGLSGKAFGMSQASGLAALAAEAALAQTDRVLVVLRLAGGNDGLNTVLPLDQYDNLAKARSNILIPENKALKLNMTTGLHPSLTGMQNLFKDGKLRIIQAVGYPSHNQSHFRSTDIYFSASDSKDVVSTGWLGRYLDTIYPGYPLGYPTPEFPDPPAIQIGSSLLGLLQGPEVPMGFAVSNPNSIYTLIPAGLDTAPKTPAGHELTFIRLIATETQKYGESIKRALANATNKSSLYATSGNKLSDQLKAVARLIAGGLKTKIFVVEAGGFDTHSNQVDSTGDTTTGNHAELLSGVDQALTAFQDDLKLLGIENRVMGVTMSEFGRRILSNASFGTDHGTAAPLFIWGAKVSGGILGVSPTIANTVTVRDNVAMQYDFRSVYATLLQDWLGVSDLDRKSILLKDFDILPLVNTAIRPSRASHGISLEQNFPNPFRGVTTLRYRVDANERVRLKLFNAQGTLVRMLADHFHVPGTYTQTIEAGTLAPGTYFYQLEMGGRTQQQQMEIIR